MVFPSLGSPSRRAKLSDTLTQLLTMAGVGRRARIRILGPGGFAALLWFCRHGYEQVDYVTAGSTQSDDSDLLLLPHACDASELEAVLRHGPRPREGGMLIVQAAETHAAGEDDPVEAVLRRSGYRIEGCVRGRRREVCIARRQVRPQIAKAA